MRKADLKRTKAYYEAKLLPVIPDIDVLRSLMEYSINDSKVASAFYHCTRSIDDNSLPVWIGFKAISCFLTGFYLSQKPDNFFWFSEGKRLLDSAIEQEPINPELRLIRFIVQHILLPGSSIYDWSVEEDRSFLLEIVNNDALSANFDKEFRLLVKKMLQHKAIHLVN